MASGSGKDFVAAIVVVDADTVGSHLEKAGVGFSGYIDLSQQDMVSELIKNDIDKLNEEFAKAKDLCGLQIKRFTILHKQLDPLDGELTQTGKLRRKEVNKRLKKVIDALHSDKNNVELRSKMEAGKSNPVLLKIRDAEVNTNAGLDG